MRAISIAVTILAGAFLAVPVCAGPLDLGLPPLSNVSGTLGGITTRADAGLDTDLRLVRDSVGRPSAPRLIAKDRSGFHVVRGEVLALSPNDASLEVAHRLNFSVIRRETLDSLGLNVTVLQIPDGMSTAEALDALHRADPAGAYDLNHLYGPSGSDKREAPDKLRAADLAHPNRSVRIGMIDAGFDPHLGVFESASVTTKDCGTRTVVTTEHGTAVASLLVGSDDNIASGLPGAALYAADVFCGSPTGGNALAIVRALAWLAANNVTVVNVSLCGPANVLLAAAVQAFQKQGRVIVAAVGNDGPAAGIEYPAGYPGVVGVTSVDDANEIQTEANRGADVAFAARGVEVAVAGMHGGHDTVSGTSFAAPIVAARFSLLLPMADSRAVFEAWTRLQRAAKHLGPPGRNDIFGYGLLDRPHFTDAVTAVQ